VELAAATEERRLIGEGAAARSGAATYIEARCAAVEALLAASEKENVALRSEVATRAAELAAAMARERAQAELARLRAKQRALPASIDALALEVAPPPSPQPKDVGGLFNRGVSSPPAAPSPSLSGRPGPSTGDVDGVSPAAKTLWRIGEALVGADVDAAGLGASPLLGQAAVEAASIGARFGWGASHDVPLPKCGYEWGTASRSAEAKGSPPKSTAPAPSTGAFTEGASGVAALVALHAADAFLKADSSEDASGVAPSAGASTQSPVQKKRPGAMVRHDTRAANLVSGAVVDGGMGHANVEAYGGRAANGAVAGAFDTHDGVVEAVTAASLEATRAQLGAARAECARLEEECRLSRREASALARSSEADAAMCLALVARLEASDERLGTSEARAGALQRVAEAQAAELLAVRAQLDAANGRAVAAERGQAALKARTALQAESHEVTRRADAALREELAQMRRVCERYRGEVSRVCAELHTTRMMVAHLNERLDAQSELARLQIGLDPVPHSGGMSPERKHALLARKQQGTTRTILQSVDGAAGVAAGAAAGAVAGAAAGAAAGGKVLLAGATTRVPLVRVTLRPYDRAEFGPRSAAREAKGDGSASQPLNGTTFQPVGGVVRFGGSQGAVAQEEAVAEVAEVAAAMEQEAWKAAVTSAATFLAESGGGTGSERPRVSTASQFERWFDWGVAPPPKK
jgi:hypothetical protein